MAVWSRTLGCADITITRGIYICDRKVCVGRSLARGPSEHPCHQYALVPQSGFHVIATTEIGDALGSCALPPLAAFATIHRQEHRAMLFIIEPVSDARGQRHGDVDTGQ
jgi:hypothetical protein